MKNKIIIYDFDGTLTPFPTTKYEVLVRCGLTEGEGLEKFYNKVTDLRKNHNEDNYSSFLHSYLYFLKEYGYKPTKETIGMGAYDVVLNKGVLKYLEYTNKLGIKNYLISSGIKTYLEFTKVYPLFKDIYASTLKFDENEIAYEIEYALTDVLKVDSIKEILRKNNIDENDCSDVIYIGDGLTDIYAFEYVKKHGGESILVYNENTEDIASEIKMKDVITFMAESDYSFDSELITFIKTRFNLEFQDY